MEPEKYRRLLTESIEREGNDTEDRTLSRATLEV